jgi:hypothetical protein
MEMKRKISKTIDRIMKAAHDVCQECLTEAHINMISNQKVEPDGEGNIITYQTEGNMKTFNRLYQIRDEIYNSKVAFNMEVNYLKEDDFPNKTNEILSKVTNKHLEFINEANDLILNLK